LVREVTDDDLDRASRTVPAGRFILASFARKVKASEEFLRVVRRLLIEIPESHFLFVGTGTSPSVETFRSDSSLRSRITVINENVDLNVYGRIVDVVLDTFPFVGMVALREIGVHGKPTVSMLAGDRDRCVREERDPLLIAKSADEYVALVKRLFRDRGFYSSRAQAAREFVGAYTGTSETVDGIEDGIRELRRRRRGSG